MRLQIDDRNVMLNCCVMSCDVSHERSDKEVFSFAFYAIWNKMTSVLPAVVV